MGQCDWLHGAQRKFAFRSKSEAVTFILIVTSFSMYLTVLKVGYVIQSNGYYISEMFQILTHVNPRSEIDRVSDDREK
jgi:hypothetical protein